MRRNFHRERGTHRYADHGDRGVLRFERQHMLAHNLNPGLPIRFRGAIRKSRDIGCHDRKPGLLQHLRQPRNLQAAPGQAVKQQDHVLLRGVQRCFHE